MPEQTFGEFVTQKRKQKELSLREFARRLGISPVYTCNIEKNRRAAPTDEFLERIAGILLLNDEDRLLMLDLAARSKGFVTVPVDLPEYIMQRDVVRAALRTAKDADTTDKEWEEFIERITANAKQRGDIAVPPKD